MHVLSPYGKDSATELRTVYGFATPDDAAQLIVQHVQEAYGFAVVALDTLHIAYGLTAKLHADGASYYLKFASRSMHARPEQLFPWLAYVRQQGVPFPEIVPLRDGRWFAAPLAQSDYDVVYLMRAQRGGPMRAVHAGAVQQYGEVMAQVHRLGLQYAHPVVGSLATWNSKWHQRAQLWQDLHTAPGVSSAVLSHAMHLIEHTGPHTFSASMLHGDFRLCHVFFHDDRLTGIIDVDQSTYGERWVDLCYGLVSGADPERGSLFDFATLQTALHMYQRALPLPEGDRVALKAAFAYAVLETLRDLLPGVIAGTASVQDLEVTQQLGAHIFCRIGGRSRSAWLRAAGSTGAARTGG